MNNSHMNDFAINILQDLNEIQSIIKVLKNSVSNENSEIEMNDISNTLEIVIAKTLNTQKSLDKFINTAFK